MTTQYDFGSVLGQPLDMDLLGSHNSMVTDLGSCVKWPRYVAQVTVYESRSTCIAQLKFLQVYTTRKCGYGTHFPSSKGDH